MRASQTIIVGLASASHVALGVALQLAIITRLGATESTDAIFSASTIPQVFSAVVAVSLANVLTPVFSGQTEEDQASDRWTILFIVTALLGTIAFALSISSMMWMRVIVPGFRPQVLELSADLLSIMSLNILLTGVIAIQSARSFARREYAFVDVAGCVGAVAAVAFFMLFEQMIGVYAACWALVGKNFVQCAILFRGMGSARWPALDRPIIKNCLRMTVPLILGSGYYKMDPLVDRFLLSSLPGGGLSLFNIGQQLNSAGSQVIFKAIGVPIVTEMAVLHKAGEVEAYRVAVYRGLRNISILSSIGMVLFILMAWLFIDNVPYPSKISYADMRSLIFIISLMSGMMVFAALGSMIANAFYAEGDTVTPTKIGSAAFTVAIPIKIMLFYFYGINGLAIAVSLYYIGSFAAMFFKFYRRSKSGHI